MANFLSFTNFGSALGVKPMYNLKKFCQSSSSFRSIIQVNGNNCPFIYCVLLSIVICTDTRWKWTLKVLVFSMTSICRLCITVCLVVYYRRVCISLVYIWMVLVGTGETVDWQRLMPRCFSPFYLLCTCMPSTLQLLKIHDSINVLYTRNQTGLISLTSHLWYSRLPKVLTSGHWEGWLLSVTLSRLIDKTTL